jgi:hypothetical protein
MKAFFRKFFKLASGSHSHQLQHSEYEFCREFIEDTKAGNMHPLQIEIGSRVITGTYLKACEVLYLINFPQPSVALHDYGHGKRFLIFDEAEKFIKFKDSYQKRESRKLHKILYSLSCSIFVGISIILTVCIVLGKIALSATLLIPCCLYLAFLGWKTIRDLDAASRIVSQSNLPKPRPKFSSVRGLIWMADDFNGPIDHFEGYYPEFLTSKCEEVKK